MDGLFPALRWVLFATSFGAVAACGALPDPRDPLDIAARTMIGQDPYDGLWRAQGPKVHVWGKAHVRSYRLRTVASDPAFSRDPDIQLDVVVDLDEWLFLDRAHSKGVRFDVFEIDREVDTCTEYGCELVETVGVIISIAQARTMATGAGFDVRISGDEGAITLFVPAGYFAGFLGAIGKMQLHAAPN